eukprot:scpid112241/ scgid27829/ 
MDCRWMCGHVCSAVFVSRLETCCMLSLKSVNFIPVHGQEKRRRDFEEILFVSFPPSLSCVLLCVHNVTIPQSLFLVYIILRGETRLLFLVWWHRCRFFLLPGVS